MTTGNNEHIPHQPVDTQIGSVRRLARLGLRVMAAEVTEADYRAVLAHSLAEVHTPAGFTLYIFRIDTKRGELTDMPVYAMESGEQPTTEERTPIRTVEEFYASALITNPGEHRAFWVNQEGTECVPYDPDSHVHHLQLINQGSAETSDNS